MRPRKLLQKALSSPANLGFEEACALGEHPKPATHDHLKTGQRRPFPGH